MERCSNLACLICYPLQTKTGQVLTGSRARLRRRGYLMEVWLVWLRDGEWGDTNLMDPAHRTRESAMAWCNENRKLSDGDPVRWNRSGGADPADYGESGHVVILPASRKSKEIRETRHYSLQVMKVADYEELLCADAAAVLDDDLGDLDDEAFDG